MVRLMEGERYGGVLRSWGDCSYLRADTFYGHDETENTGVHDIYIAGFCGGYRDLCLEWNPFKQRSRYGAGD